MPCLCNAQAQPLPQREIAKPSIQSPSEAKARSPTYIAVHPPHNSRTATHAQNSVTSHVTQLVYSRTVRQSTDWQCLSSNAQAEQQNSSSCAGHAEEASHRSCPQYHIKPHHAQHAQHARHAHETNSRLGQPRPQGRRKCTVHPTLAPPPGPRQPAKLPANDTHSASDTLEHQADTQTTGCKMINKQKSRAGVHYCKRAQCAMNEDCPVHVAAH